MTILSAIFKKLKQSKPITHNLTDVVNPWYELFDCQNKRNHAFEEYLMT